MSQQPEAAKAFLFSVTPIVLWGAWLLSGSDALAITIQVFAWLIIGCVAVATFCVKGPLPDVPPLSRPLKTLCVISTVSMIAALFMMHAVVALLMFIAATIAARILASKPQDARGR